MATEESLAFLEQGPEAWNTWRRTIYPHKRRIIQSNRLDQALGRVNDPDLSGVALKGFDFRGYNLRYTNFDAADLTGARFDGVDLHKARFVGATLASATFDRSILFGASLTGSSCVRTTFNGATLTGAQLVRADLTEAKLPGAILGGASLCDANLYKANLRGAELVNVRLVRTRLIETDLSHARIDGCALYGASVWGVRLEGATQRRIVITPKKQARVIVDSLEVGQFVYLLLQNNKIRDAIDAIVANAVLILGRFTHERKAVLETVRAELNARGYLPILFDFQGPRSRDVTETVSTLAHLARFIIVDVTEPRSVPQELQRIVPDLPSVPVQPLIQEAAAEYGMFEHFRSYSWVLPAFAYRDQEHVVTAFSRAILDPAERAVASIRARREKRG